VCINSVEKFSLRSKYLAPPLLTGDHKAKFHFKCSHWKS